jgi:hypothetical protein
MKVCSKCKLRRRLSSFYKRKRGPRVGEYYEKCKNCMKLRGRSYYYLTRERQLELVKIRRKNYVEERKKYINKTKNKPCVDCGKIYPPWVMDFDHREGTLKLSSIGGIHSGRLWSFEKIDEEIAKCELVCANCHRQRTHDRLERRKLAEVANVVKASL